MPNDISPRMQVRVRGRSFMAFVIAPEPPLALWLRELDAQMCRSPGFFDARPIVVDLVTLSATDAGVDTLIADLEARGIGIIDVENARDLPGADPWRRRLVGGRDTGETAFTHTSVATSPAAGVAPEAPPVQPDSQPPQPTSLTVPTAVRSGQSVQFLTGDVTVVGAISSGAEVMAAGSIHVYGALRGRAIAGALGNAEARIFCRKFEAELVSIDGYYLTEDGMDPAWRGRAVEIHLTGQAITISLLD